MRKVKWGVLGCAGFAKSTAIPAMALAKNVELTGIASRDLSKAEAFAAEFGFKKSYGSYEAMLADPEIEAVYNPLPNGLHPEWAIKCAQAGKHTIVEKPFAANVQEAESVAAAAEKYGVKIMEAFMWRFHPTHQRARQLIRDGAIGKLTHVKSSFTFEIARSPNVRLDPKMAGGGIMDVGVYCISAARFLFDAEPIKVYASADYDAEFEVDMMAAGMLEFPEGRCTWDAGFTLPFRCNYEAVGTKGSIIAPFAFLPHPDAELIVEINGSVETEKFPGFNQWTLEFEHLSQSIIDGSPLAYDSKDAICQQKVVDAVYKSTHSGAVESV